MLQNDNEWLAYELQVMEHPKFTICTADLQAMTSKLSSWYDAKEDYRKVFSDPTHEDCFNFMRSGLCWQLLPREWKVVDGATATECKGCSSVTTGEYLGLEGTNHIGVTYLVHCGWLIAQAMQQAGLIADHDYKVRYVGACDECYMRESHQERNTEC